MALLVPDIGEKRLLEMALKDSVTPVKQTLKLYTNDIVPAEGHVLSTYTEMTGNGYAAKDLLRADWTVTSSAGVTTATNIQKSFLFVAGTAKTVYGYYVVMNDGTADQLLWAERFANPFTVQNDNDEIKITCKLTLE
jgi:hypothetical protein